MRMLITKKGKDIKSGFLDDYILHTDYPLLKVHAFGTFTTNILGVINITHNLGYVPYAIVFSQTTNNTVVSAEYYQLPYIINGSSFQWQGKADITTTQIKISVTDTLTSRAAVSGFYYIFKDRMDSL